MKRFLTGLFISFCILACGADTYGSAEEIASSIPVEIMPDSLAEAVTLQEVSISAFKENDRAFRLPEAATVIGAVEAERLNAISLKGLSDVVPNFFIPDYGSRITSSIYVRGIGARMDQPAVGLNVDNLPVLNKDAYDFDISDITSVEMLRGPQTALYGRNTMAGQINITTLSPFRFQGWKLKAEFSSPLNAKASIGWFHKFNARHALSLTCAASYSDGFFTNDFNGKKVDPERLISFRSKYQWRISDVVSLQNVVAVSSLHQGGYAYENVESGRIAFNDTCFYRRFLLSDALTVNYNNPHFLLSSVTSFQYIDDNMTLDQDFLPSDYFTLTQKKREPSLTEEVVIRSKRDSGSNYSWLGGFFGFYKRLQMQAPVTFYDYGIEQLIENKRNEGNPTYPISWNSRCFTLNSDFTIPTIGAALYHKSDLELGRFTLSLALRLDYEHVAMDYRSWCNTGYQVSHLLPDGTLEPVGNADVNIDDSGRLSQDFINFIPKFTALYNLPAADPSNIYINVAKGYKAGGFNTQMFSDVLQQRLMGFMGIGSSYDVDEMVSYKPEYSWNFEAGAHLSFLDSRLITEVSLFYIDCRDQQLTMFPPGNITGRMMTNAGKTRSYGLELSVNTSPIDCLSLMATFGWTDARFRKFFDGKQDYAGKFLPYVPRTTLFIQAVYSLPLKHQSLRSLEFDVNLRGTGSIYWNESNTLKQDFYVVPGCSATLSADDWQLKIFATNITDTRYHTFYFQSIGNEFLQRGKPFQIGLGFSIKI